jgi:hypothetical protein
MSKRVEVLRTPPPPGPELWIRRLKGREVLRCTVLSTELWGCHFHWTGSHSSAHFTPAEECPGCRAQHALKWRGFLHIYNEDKQCPEFLEMSPTVVKSFEVATGKDYGWRGIRVRFERGGGDRARVSCTMISSVVATENLLPAKEPTKELAILWGVPQMAEDVLIETPP